MSDKTRARSTQIGHTAAFPRRPYLRAGRLQCTSTQAMHPNASVRTPWQEYQPTILNPKVRAKEGERIPDHPTGGQDRRTTPARLGHGGPP